MTLTNKEFQYIPSNQHLPGCTWTSSNIWKLVSSVRELVQLIYLHYLKCHLFLFIIFFCINRQHQSSVSSLIWSEEIVFILIIKSQFQRLPTNSRLGCRMSALCTDVCLLRSLHSARDSPHKTLSVRHTHYLHTNSRRWPIYIYIVLWVLCTSFRQVWINAVN